MQRQEDATMEVFDAAFLKGLINDQRGTLGQPRVNQETMESVKVDHFVTSGL